MDHHRYRQARGARRDPTACRRCSMRRRRQSPLRCSLTAARLLEDQEAQEAREDLEDLDPEDLHRPTTTELRLLTQRRLPHMHTPPEWYRLMEAQRPFQAHPVQLLPNIIFIIGDLAVRVGRLLRLTRRDLNAEYTCT